ncbi:MAG: biotin/lipoyl-containing protein [Bacteroidota bacterium]
MRYTVKVADCTYEVEIEDINARPVIARVDGQTFEVVPENEPRNGSVRAANHALLPAGAAIQHMSGATMLAPLPGTVTEVFVKPGEQVEAGQVVLVIEAMKMKNSIRSLRGGIIGEVLVKPGESIVHKQPLLSFAEAGEAAWN